MNAVAITIIGVVGTALFGMLFIQLQNLREDMKEGFRAAEADRKALEVRLTDDIKGLEAKLTDDNKGLEAKLTEKFTSELKAQGKRIDRVIDALRDNGKRIDQVFDVLRGHGERLARIEVKLEIDPPAEAA